MEKEESPIKIKIKSGKKKRKKKAKLNLNNKMDVLKRIPQDLRAVKDKKLAKSAKQSSE